MGPLSGLRVKKLRKNIPSECSSTSSGSSRVFSDALSSATSVDSSYSNRSFRVLNRDDSCQSSCLDTTIFDVPYTPKEPSKIYKELIKDRKKQEKNRISQRNSENSPNVTTGNQISYDIEIPERGYPATLVRHIRKNKIEELPVLHYSSRDVPPQTFDMIELKRLKRVSSTTIRLQQMQQLESQRSQRSFVSSRSASAPILSASAPVISASEPVAPAPAPEVSAPAPVVTAPAPAPVVTASTSLVLPLVPAASALALESNTGSNTESNKESDIDTNTDPNIGLNIKSTSNSELESEYISKPASDLASGLAFKSILEPEIKPIATAAVLAALTGSESPMSPLISPGLSEQPQQSDVEQQDTTQMFASQFIMGPQLYHEMIYAESQFKDNESPTSSINYTSSSSRTITP